MTLKQLIFFRKKPDSFQKEGIIVKEVFTVAGRKFFEVDNIYALPFERGRQAVKVYEEFKMKCDYEFLKAHVTAVDNLFKGKKIGFEEITKMKNLNDQLKERLFQIIDTDIIYKLASVTFFDENESPYEYDFAYAEKKIKFWKQHTSINDFFLQEPLTRLIPFLKQPEVNFQTYSEAIKKFNQVQWDVVFSLLSESQKKTFSAVKDFYAEETLLNSTN